MNTIQKSILIDFLIPLAGAGGVERVIDVIATYLNKNGFHVRIVQLTSDGHRCFNPSLEVYPILINQRATNLDELSLLYAAFLQQYGAPDIVIATTWPYLVITARKALAAYNAPCKVLSWLHGPLDEYDRYGAGGIECLRRADYHLCISRKAADIIIKDNPNAALSVVYNPVPMEQYSPQTDYHRDNRTLLFVGRLSAEKRVDIIIRGIYLANLTHPDRPWHLRIIGDGDKHAELCDLIHELKLDNYISLLGWKDTPWADCSDVTATVLASEYEGSPLCAIESLANGIPVISTPVDGITELIAPGVNGWLYPQHDSKSLSDILSWISDGTLPDIAPSRCTDSVKAYESNTALNAFRAALHAAMDTISVIIPCYNVENYIRRCLDSILSQNITSANIEIICVDDCSTDNTLSILYEYEQTYPDIFIIIPLAQNMKQGYARNIALSYSHGNYITYLDADDCIDENMLDQLYRYSKLYDCDITECEYSQFNDDKDIPQVTSNGHITLLHLDNLEEKRYYVLNRYWKTAPWGRLYKKSFLIDNNIYFAEHCRMEDILFSAQYMCYMKSYLLLPMNYYHYYVNSQGTMFGSTINKYFMDTPTVQNMATDFLAEHGWYNDCLEEYSYLHYTKAFEEPIWRMCIDPSLYSYDSITYLKEELLKRFPEIAYNSYLMSSNSEAALICLDILTHNLCKETLDKVFLSQD